MNTNRLLAATALLSISLCTAANARPTQPEVSIPFPNHSIRDWQADKREGLWIQDQHRRWYYAKTMGPCFGLDFAWNIGFDTRHGSSFDRFSSIVVPREGRCAVQSLTRSDGPPKKVRQGRS
jgi:hypothetical protein